MNQEPDLATIASLIAEPSRAAILSALMSGEALPATELAMRAQITPQTTSSHLTKLLDGNLITVTTVGRHRYYSLKNHEVAHILETLQVLAPPAKQHIPRATKICPELCHARTCYDHLAGKLGVAVTHALIDKGYLKEEEQLYTLTDEGQAWFESQQIDLDALKNKRRKFAYACLDWSERRFHLGGSLGAALATLFFENNWVERMPNTRAIKLTHAGENSLRQDFEIQL